MPALLISVSIRPNRSSACPDHEFGGLGLSDVSRHHQHIRCCGRLDGKRRTHYGVTRRAEGCSDAGTDPLRRASDDRHLLLSS